MTTTDSRYADPHRCESAAGPLAHATHEVWVTDATWVHTGQGWRYVVALLDVVTRRVVGWAMVSRPRCRDGSACGQDPIAQVRPAMGLILHSDRGSPFDSAAYRRVLAVHGLIASMSRKENCFDNACIEAFWSSRKYEICLSPALRHAC